MEHITTPVQGHSTDESARNLENETADFKPRPAYRLTPRGLWWLIRCARAQHRHLGQTWRESVRIAWRYGPVR